MEVDAFLQKTLPELLEAEFTAQMEGKLDAIATGERIKNYLPPVQPQNGRDSFKIQETAQRLLSQMSRLTKNIRELLISSLKTFSGRKSMDFDPDNSLSLNYSPISETLMVKTPQKIDCVKGVVRCNGVGKGRRKAIMEKKAG